MWLFTTAGFYSVVQKPGEDVLTVRARVAADLDRLREQYLPSLSPTIATPHGDYGYRATIPHAAFAEGLARLAHDLHYDNFKDEVAATMGYQRASLYGQVWSMLRKLQSMEGQERRGMAPLEDIEP